MLTREQKQRRFSINDVVWRVAWGVAIVAGLFSLIVSVLMVANYLQVIALSPLDDPELVKLREQLATAPEADPALVAQVRALDLLARKAFFTSQAQLNMGAYLLLGGVIALVAALRIAASARPSIPAPAPETPAATHWLSRARSREMLAFAGAVWVILALGSAYLVRLDLPGAGSPAITASADPGGEAPAYPDWETMQRHWPSFRGPGGYGVAYFTTAPSEWDAASGKNIKWRVEVPLPGANSPVVWDKKIFLSSATEEVREVYCFDADTGQLLWQRALEPFPGTPPKPPRISEETGYAASTMAAHGDRAAALFANGDVACYDFEGNLKWGRNLGLPENHYGHSSSLLAYGSLLFVQYDQNKNGKLLALDLADGHEVWSVARNKISWSSPVCVQTPFGPQLVLNSELDVDAYDPVSGKPVWQITCLDGEVAPSPAYGGGMFFVANDNATATAIRFREGEAAPAPEIAWQWDEALPDVSSPLGSGQHFYITTSRGEIVCLDQKTGEPAWVQEYDEGFYASPILAGNRIYAVDKEGTTFVFKTGATYELIATSKLDEEVFATPAVLDGRIYFRTAKHLLCIGN
jgi:outer membrane protein assembly factor BamB